MPRKCVEDWMTGDDAEEEEQGGWNAQGRAGSGADRSQSFL